MIPAGMRRGMGDVKVMSSRKAEEKTTAKTDVTSVNKGMDFTSHSYSKLTDLVREHSKHFVYIKTGLHAVDEMLGGGLLSGITVLGAKPTTGKTTLALQIAAHVARERPVLFFSLESSAAHIVAKIKNHFINAGGRDATSLGLLTGEELDDAYSAVEKLDSVLGELYIFSLEMDYGSSGGKEQVLSTDMIVKIIRDFHRQSEKVPLVIIDYLQLASLMDGIERRGSLQTRESVERAVLKLSKCAHRDNIPMLIISSTNRAFYKDGEDPSLSMFRESGTIEYSSDCALALTELNEKEPEKKKGTKKEQPTQQTQPTYLPVQPLRLVVLKNRYGRAGVSTDLLFYKEKDIFRGADDPDVQSSSWSDKGEDKSPLSADRLRRING